VSATRELPLSFVALLLCTCRRWDRATTKLIEAAEDRGLLGDADLDDLADSFLTHGLEVSYRLAWISPQRLEIDLRVGTSRTHTEAKQVTGLFTMIETTS